MAVSALLRSVQSDLVRDLARRAVAQGWDLYPNGGGHLAAVHPVTGAQVTLATSAGGGHATENVRAAFRRAGLDLRSKAERRRSRRQEVHPMQVRDVTPAPPPLPVVPIPEAEDRRRGRLPTNLASREALDIGGRRVVIRQGTGGRWSASTRDAAYKTGRRSWAGLDRDAMVDRIARDLAEEAAAEEAAVEESATRLADVHLPDPEAVAAVEGGPLAGFHVVQADPEEFPLAAHLAALDAAVAPALAALEAAGKVDAAGLLRAEVERSPLEEELVRLYRRVMSGD